MYRFFNKVVKKNETYATIIQIEETHIWVGRESGITISDFNIEYKFVDEETQKEWDEVYIQWRAKQLLQGKEEKSIDNKEDYFEEMAKQALKLKKERERELKKMEKEHIWKNIQYDDYYGNTLENDKQIYHDTNIILKKIEQLNEIVKRQNE